MTSRTEDRELLEAWRGGDQGSGTQLVRRHFESLSRFFRNRAPEHRVDLLQRVWLGCVESRDRVPDHVPFKVYLMGIARRVLIQYYREQQRHPDASRSAEIRDRDRSPSALLVIREEEKLLLEALRRLPLDMQLTLELFYWEELPIADVARVLEIPPGTVKSRLSRAKQLLREQIAALKPPEALLRSTQDDLQHWARSIRRFLGRPTQG